MPYLESITIAGKTKEIERYYSSKYMKRGMTRNDHVKPTKEEQKKVNTRQAEKKLRLLINNNFKYQDLHIVLGYQRAKDEPHRTKKEMRKDIDKFLRLLRLEFKKQNLELKYIHVMEIGERGARHHHLVINYIDSKSLQKCWEWGRVQLFPLDKSGQYKKLANYLIKQTDKAIGTDKELQGKRWNPSKNLIRPESTIRIISHRDWFRSDPKDQKGYYIDLETVEKGIHNPEYYGYGYFRYTLIKLD